MIGNDPVSTHSPTVRASRLLTIAEEEAVSRKGASRSIRLWLTKIDFERRRSAAPASTSRAGPAAEPWRSSPA
jgi:hypothetical protein